MRRSRLRRRAFVLSVLDDIGSGAQSALEWGYLQRVERAHGLPRASRQVSRRTAGGKEYRDIEYEACGLVIELDGRLNHDSWEAENRDADRDLADAADGKVTIRLRWRQVFATPCQTAGRIEAVLRQRGSGCRAKPCGPRCTIGSRSLSVESASRLE
jgi:very-short-patch-repair endonuclease